MDENTRKKIPAKVSVGPEKPRKERTRCASEVCTGLIYRRRRLPDPTSVRRPQEHHRFIRRVNAKGATRQEGGTSGRRGKKAKSGRPHLTCNPLPSPIDLFNPVAIDVVVLALEFGAMDSGSIVRKDIAVAVLATVGRRGRIAGVIGGC